MVCVVLDILSCNLLLHVVITSFQRDCDAHSATWLSCIFCNKNLLHEFHFSSLFLPPHPSRSRIISVFLHFSFSFFVLLLCSQHSSPHSSAQGEKNFWAHNYNVLITRCIFRSRTTTHCWRRARGYKFRANFMIISLMENSSAHFWSWQEKFCNNSISFPSFIWHIIWLWPGGAAILALVWKWTTRRFMAQYFSALIIPRFRRPLVRASLALCYLN